jgi:hypothetical protein
VILSSVTACLVCFLCILPISILKPSPTSNLDAIETSNPNSEITPKSSCANLRFAEHLGPDDVDEMINAGSTFKNVSEITVRFDCPPVNVDQITWAWKRNGGIHCTNTFQSNECDQSKMISWDSLPGKYLITLFSKGGYLENLQSGRYELVIFIMGVKTLDGTIYIEN